MPAPTVKGVAVVWGIPTARQAGTGYETTGATYEEKATFKKLMDDTGATKTLIWHDPSETLKLDLYPSGVAPGVVPKPGDTVAVNAVNYSCMSAQEVNTADGEQKITMELEKWAGVTL